MKKYTHAWLAFMAIKRLEDADLSIRNRRCAKNLIKWFRNHKDGVIQGAWYPDAIICDMASSHVLKMAPSDNAQNVFKNLPGTYLSSHHTEDSPLKDRSFKIDRNDNLPSRCEALSHSVVDHLKMQESEEKGSPVTPTDNQVALLLFMLSHYVADAHVPPHCDERKFSKGDDIHGKIEGEWNDGIEEFYWIDEENERFYYDPKGYPLRNLDNNDAYQASIFKRIEDELNKRHFIYSYGSKNDNVWDFMSAVCQYSYLLSYLFIPEGNDHTNVTTDNWKGLGNISFDDLSVAVLTDAIDSIARVWLRIWRRYLEWVN